MEINEILQLIEKGFTPQQIIDLSTNIQEDVEVAESKEDVEPVKETNSELNNLKKEISELKNIIHQNNIRNDEMPISDSTESASDIIKKVLFE